MCKGSEGSKRPGDTKYEREDIGCGGDAIETRPASDLEARGRRERCRERGRGYRRGWECCPSSSEGDIERDGADIVDTMYRRPATWTSPRVFVRPAGRFRIAVGLSSLQEEESG